jgi:hypothetical protein
MREMQKKIKRIQNIQGRTQAPLKSSHKDGKDQFPPTKQQSEKKHQGVW